MANRRYKRLTKVEGPQDILNHAAHVIDHLGEISVQERSVDGLASAGALLLELARFYVEDGEEEGDSEVTTETELSEQEDRPTMGFTIRRVDE